MERKVDDLSLPYELISVILHGTEMLVAEKEEGKAPHFFLTLTDFNETVKKIRGLLEVVYTIN